LLTALNFISYLDFSKFNRESLGGWDNSEIKLLSGNSVLTILIFFGTNGCPIYLKSLVRWNKVKADYSNSVQIIAVSPEKNREYYKELIELYNLKYDLAIDGNCQVFRYLAPEIYTSVFEYFNNKNEVLSFGIFETMPKTSDLLNKHIGNYIKIAILE
jgi:hypothetical protein